MSGVKYFTTFLEIQLDEQGADQTQHVRAWEASGSAKGSRARDRLKGRAEALVAGPAGFFLPTFRF
jgi:hypothetical protein